MGAFGIETMGFEQWIQFVLIERIHQIVNEEGEFPSESNVGVYAIRVFDTDPWAGDLTRLLSELDALINPESESFISDPNEFRGQPITGSTDDLPLPVVVINWLKFFLP